MNDEEKLELIKTILYSSVSPKAQVEAISKLVQDNNGTEPNTKFHPDQYPKGKTLEWTCSAQDEEPDSIGVKPAKKYGEPF